MSPELEVILYVGLQQHACYTIHCKSLTDHDDIEDVLDAFPLHFYSISPLFWRIPGEPT